MRYVVTLISIVALLTGCSSDLVTPTTAPVGVNTGAGQPNTNPAAAVVPASTQKLQGLGQKAPTINLRAGLAQFRMTAAGDSNFIVQLLDSNANLIDGLANEIGAYDGGTAVRIPTDGQYTLNIEAPGQWTIEVIQPGSADFAGAVTLPRTFSGKNHAYTELFIANTGGLHLTMKHTGQANFIVKILDAQGRLVDLPANVIGTFAGAKVVRVSDKGVYIMVITADGPWKVEAGQ